MAAGEELVLEASMALGGELDVYADQSFTFTVDLEPWLQLGFRYRLLVENALGLERSPDIAVNTAVMLNMDSAAIPGEE